jgi:alpha-1,6-mannosyltransferase
MDEAPLHLLDCTMFWSATGGGVQRYLRAKQQWLRAQGDVRHSIVAPSDQPGIVDCGGWPIPRSGGYRFPWRRGALSHQLQALRPDVIEAADPFGLAWAALDAGQRLGVPVVAFCHSDLPRLAERWAGGQGRAAAWARRTAAAYLHRLYRHFDLVLAPSAAMTGDLQALGIAQARHQPLGVDTRVFHPGRADPAWRRSLGLTAQTRLLLYTGRLAPEKNLPALVAAVQRLGPPHVLLLAGHGPATPAQSERVRVLPHISNEVALARLVASADLFVHAGDQETFGLSMLEAMACGTPVMVRAAGGLAELVAGGAGIGLPDNRPATWADAIGTWFSGRQRLDPALQPGLALARARGHDWQVLLPQWWARLHHLHQMHEPLPDAAAAGSDERATTEPGVLWH